MVYITYFFENSCGQLVVEFAEYLALIGSNIRRLRNEKGLSQIDLSAISEIEQSNIAQFENGKGNPTLKTLYRIAVALEVKLATLFDFDTTD